MKPEGTNRKTDLQPILKPAEEYPSLVRWILFFSVWGMAIAALIAVLVNLEHLQFWKIALYFILLGAYLMAERKTHAAVPPSIRRGYEPLRYGLSLAWWILIFGSVGVYATWPTDEPAITALGGILMAVGSVLRIWSVSTLGHWYSGHVETFPGQVVVRTGPYRVLRHPGYAGTILQTIGLPLVVNAYYSLPWTVIVIGLFIIRISWEEKWLIENLPEYRDYRNATWGLIPGVW